MLFALYKLSLHFSFAMKPQKKYTIRMKISKYLHACLLVEEQGKTALFDPGVFTAQEKALDVNKLNNLDYLLITHEHPDHFHLPLVKELVAKFPQVKIITNPSIVSLL